MIQQTLEPEAFNEPPDGASPPANMVLAQGRLPTPGEGAGPMTELELLGLMRKHCQKSWQATRWLLEMKFPERYGKRKANQPAGPDLSQLWDAVLDVLSEEIVDETLRERIEARLDKLSAQEFAATPKPAAQPKPENMVQPPDSDQDELSEPDEAATSPERHEPEVSAALATAEKSPMTFQQAARMRWLRRRAAQQQRRLNKLRNHDRKKQCKQRVHAKRLKRSTARARPG